MQEAPFGNPYRQSLARLQDADDMGACAARQTGVPLLYRPLYRRGTAAVLLLYRRRLLRLLLLRLAGCGWRAACMHAWPRSLLNLCGLPSPAGGLLACGGCVRGCPVLLLPVTPLWLLACGGCVRGCPLPVLPVTPLWLGGPLIAGRPLDRWAAP